MAAAYNDEKSQIHYIFQTDQPNWHHQYWRYDGGEWVRYGSGGPMPAPSGLYEDRISILLDDGSVDGFGRYGGWKTVHEGMRTLTSEVDSDSVSCRSRAAAAAPSAPRAVTWTAIWRTRNWNGRN
ncbi:hypothetical protein Mlg_2718 [Alkalilimnicola ehrlichii MLHE-1]|uniref:Cytochrome c-552/DMSO reductase-like haem-binding domain-containing protein n=1 Tax=Alkalilimnicola ehrlichii (strain ATCC BAA-1101 / DSM 17681 / MLHE-1) TaxID=187272 RepID=Q0A529_ALKEH|nr:hypothetical protein Mlg_2718 [Alkalilimnicola ehrlichii MLHE-1]